MSTVLEPKQVVINLQPHLRALRQRLAAMRRRIRAALALEGAVWVFGTAALLAALSLAIDKWLRLGTQTRVALGLAATALILAVAYRKLIAPVRLALDDMDLAHVLDRRQKGVAEHVANVLQLPLLLENGHHASASMVDAAVRRHAGALERLELESLIDSRRRKQLIGAACLLVAVVASFPLLWPETARIWAKRWLLGSSVRWPQTTYVFVRGLGERSTLLAPRGEPLVLEVSAQPKPQRAQGGWRIAGRGESLVVESADPPVSAIPDQVSIVHWTDGGTKRTGNFTRYEGSNFRYELPPLSDVAHFRITADDDWLGPIRVQPIDRPTVASISLMARGPGQTKATRYPIGEGDQPLSFLPQTALELNVESRQPLEDAELLSKGAPLKLVRKDERHFQTSWTMAEGLTLELRLIGKVGRLSSKPYFVTIGLLLDREPRVMVRSSGVGRRVTPTARIPLSVRVLDDFGIKLLALELEKNVPQQDKLVTTTSQIVLEKPAATTRQAVDFERSPELALREQNLFVGNTVKVRAAAVDDCLLGSHTGRSRWLSYQIVAPEELFYEILTRQREQRGRFAAALASAKTQRELLSRLDKPGGVVGLTRAHQVLARQVWQIAGQLDASLEEMTLNDLATPAARQLMSTNIIAPIRKLHAEPLRKLREQLDRLAAAKTIQEGARTKAVELEDEIITSMQRILDRMAEWESFVDVVNQLRQIIKSQNQVLRATEDANKDRNEKVFDD